jgi:hypothetical protein
MSLIYNPNDYNRDEVLKVPLFLIMAMLFLLKHWLLAMLPALHNVNYLSAFARHHLHWSLLLSTLPALLLLAALTQRTPKGGAWARYCWRRGRLWLSAGFSVDLLLLAGLSLAGLIKMGEYILIIAALDCMFLFYLWHAPRVHDVFKEFPPAKEIAHGR